MPALTLYGISNCDTVKKARRWLDQRQIPYQFHDFRKDGLSQAHVNAWFAQLTVDELLNKRSRTWRDLPESEKHLGDIHQAVALCCKYPTLLKRPVLVSGRRIVVGFDPENYTSLFAP